MWQVIGFILWGVLGMLGLGVVLGLAVAAIGGMLDTAAYRALGMTPGDDDELG